MVGEVLFLLSSLGVQAAGNSGKAREVYKEALEKTPTSKSLWQVMHDLSRSV